MNEALALATAKLRDVAEFVRMPAMDSLNWSSIEIRWLRVDREKKGLT